MATINTLPAKIIDNICGHMPQRDNLSLALTCRHLNRFTLPGLFRSVTLTTCHNTVACSFIKAAEKHGGHVRELHIVLPTARCGEDKCNLCTSTARDLYLSPWGSNGGVPALQLLRGEFDKILPRLHHILISYPNRFGGHQPVAYEWDPLDDEEQRSAKLKQARQWAAIEEHNLILGNTAFAALMRRGGDTTIKKFTIVNLPNLGLGNHPLSPKESWRAFLGSLEDFDLSLWAGEREKGLDWGCGWTQYPNHDGYTQFVECLPWHFFDHLTSVKHLRFECSLHAAVGQVDPEERSGPLPFRSRPLPLVNRNSPANTMPRLESLELVKIMVDQPLLDFLATRVGMPSLALTLTDARAYRHDFLEATATRGEWARILDGIQSMVNDSKGLKLQQFQLKPLVMTGSEWANEKRRKLSDPEMPLFRYACLEFVMSGYRQFGSSLRLSDAGLFLGCEESWEGDYEAEIKLQEAIARSNKP